VRRLAATASNVKSPAWLADQMHALAAEAAGLDVVVRDEGWLADHGFGGLLAVGSASSSPPLLVVADYRPAVVAAGIGEGRHVALVGKGITFDTGGLSVKGREAMSLMKTDMAGAAAAMAAVVGAARAGVRHRVTAVLPLAENALGAASYRPGDVLTAYDGTTVEVLNTDAEGRLVLADALAWVRAELRPDVVVDIATLTGAASLGLGRRHAALYATDEALAAGLLAAGEATGERAWRMPLVADYAGALDSPVADVAHVSRDEHVRGGSILAALFLRRFVGGLPWAHLDIAGPARATRTEHEVTEGPTGFGARLLLRWLEDLPAS
jgi:leucyl aminopeptidase